MKGGMNFLGLLVLVLLLVSCDARNTVVVYEQARGEVVSSSVSPGSPGSVVDSDSVDSEGSTFIGSITNAVRSRSSSSRSSSSSSSNGDGVLDLDVPDQNMEQDSGFHNNFVDLYAFTNDKRVLMNELSFSLVKQTNLGVVSCKVDFGRYVDCTAQAGQFGYSELTVRVSDGADAYDDLFVVSVLGEGVIAPVQEVVAVVVTPVVTPVIDPVASNTAPTLAVVADQTATVGDLFSLQLVGSDAQGDSIVYSDNSGLFAVSSSGLIEFTPGSAGIHTISITVTDGSLSFSRSFALTISAPAVAGENSAPVIVGIGNQLATVGEHFDLTVVATDAQGDSISYSEDSSLFVVDGSSGAISFVPSTSDIGVYTIMVTASDGVATSSSSFVLVIVAADSPPDVPEQSGSSPFSDSNPTNSWMSYYGSLTVSGAEGSIGDQVAAFDAAGNLAGKFIVTAAGNYGFLHVYADDAATSADEGMSAGETVTFKVWDKSGGNVFVGSTATWQGTLERINLDLVVG